MRLYGTWHAYRNCEAPVTVCYNLPPFQPIFSLNALRVACKKYKCYNSQLLKLQLIHWTLPHEVTCMEYGGTLTATFWSWGISYPTGPTFQDKEGKQKVGTSTPRTLWMKLTTCSWTLPCTSIVLSLCIKFAQIVYQWTGWRAITSSPTVKPSTTASQFHGSNAATALSSFWPAASLTTERVPQPSPLETGTTPSWGTGYHAQIVSHVPSCICHWRWRHNTKMPSSVFLRATA